MKLRTGKITAKNPIGTTRMTTTISCAKNDMDETDMATPIISPHQGETSSASTMPETTKNADNTIDSNNICDII